MTERTKTFTPPVLLPEELHQPGRKVEHFEVRVPSPLEVDEMRNYPREVMRAVALAANEAGMSGKRLDGFAMIEDGGMSPRIVFQVSSEIPDQDLDDEPICLCGICLGNTVQSQCPTRGPAALSIPPTSGDNTTE